MARPPKKPEQRMDVDLRIPVTAAQKDLVQQAAMAAGMDMASWARPILHEAAKREIAKTTGTKRRLNR